jgi:hypothetical protein
MVPACMLSYCISVCTCRGPRTYLAPSPPRKYVPSETYKPQIDERSKQLAAKIRPKVCAGCSRWCLLGCTVVQAEAGCMWWCRSKSACDS